MSRTLLPYEKSIGDFADDIIVRARLEDNGMWSAGIELGLGEEPPIHMIAYDEDRGAAVEKAALIARQREPWLRQMGYLSSDLKWFWTSREILVSCGADPDRLCEDAERAGSSKLWNISGKQERCIRASTRLEFGFNLAVVQAVTKIKRDGISAEDAREMIASHMKYEVSELRFVRVDPRPLKERLDFFVEEVEKLFGASSPSL